VTGSSAGTLRAIATRSAKSVAMITRMQATVDPMAGLDGDFHRKPGKRAVTVLALEKWNAACADVGADLPWTTRRANLLISGVDLPDKPGRRLRIGPVVLQITGETHPCDRMDAQHAGLTHALTPDQRGGVCCRIIEGGEIAVGDTVTLL